MLKKFKKFKAMDHQPDHVRLVNRITVSNVSQKLISKIDF